MFKQCLNCKTLWTDRDSFLTDPGIELIGYQVHFKNLELGALMFNHSCGSTLALKAELFSDLYQGPFFDKPATGSDECPGYCLRQSQLAPCKARCECAYVREILQIVRYWPGQTSFRE